MNRAQAALIRRVPKAGQRFEHFVSLWWNLFGQPSDVPMSSSAPITAEPPRLVPGRECGSCSMCCKVYNIAEINKPAGKWCPHCKPKKGCVIHDALPRQCAEFNCQWRLQEQMPAHWKPDQAKMVVTIHPVNGYVLVQVDHSAPSAWRRQPYYDQLRIWAKQNLHLGIYVLVCINLDVTLVLPDQDIPLGPLMETDRIAVRKVGNSYEAKVIPGGH